MYTAPVLDDQALPLIRIAAPEGNYDYQHKYFTDDTQYFCPCGLPENLEAQMRDTVLRAFKVLGPKAGVASTSCWMTPAGFTCWKSTPRQGMTSHSLVPMAARVAGIEFDALCLRIPDGAHVG